MKLDILKLIFLIKYICYFLSKAVKGLWLLYNSVCLLMVSEVPGIPKLFSLKYDLFGRVEFFSHRKNWWFKNAFFRHRIKYSSKLDFGFPNIYF